MGYEQQHLLTNIATTVKIYTLYNLPKLIIFTCGLLHTNTLFY